MLRTPPHPADQADRTERLLAAVRVALVAALTALVLAIAALAYVVSFEAIRAFAIETAAFPLAWSAPLLVDSFTTAASLVILWRYLRGESWRAPWYAWTLVGCATAVSVALNVAHAPKRLAAQLFAALPPVALPGALELLMSVARAGLPHTHRTRAAEDCSGDGDPTATAVAWPQLPAPDHATVAGNGSGPPRDSRTRVRELVARERAPASACTRATWPPRPGSANAAPMSCSAPSGPRSQRPDPSALCGVQGGRVPVPLVRQRCTPQLLHREEPDLRRWQVVRV
jgi:hypothetical protein